MRRDALFSGRDQQAKVPGLKITGLDAWKVHLKLTEPVTIACRTIEIVTNIFIRIETSRGIEGYGCAVPDPGEIGDAIGLTHRKLLYTVPPIVCGSDPLRGASVLKRLERPLRKHPAALAAVDMALYDILGKVAGLPLWKLLGGYRNRIQTSVTVDAIPLDDTIKRAREWVRQGFCHLKLRGGFDVEQDIARVIRVRETVGDKIGLRFDASRGYSTEQALKFVDGTRRARLDLIERPTSHGQLDLMGRYIRGTPNPVMTDDNMMNLRDTFRQVKHKVVDLVNVKLMKVGGISAALQINAASRMAGLEAIAGCMEECTLGIAAGLHFALSSPNVRYADLDGHLRLVADPSLDAVTIQDGYLIPSERPGLGFIPMAVS
jgi:L-alanine-DL-glutamate epimerase-like enolase superfamily enzyme